MIYYDARVKSSEFDTYELSSHFMLISRRVLRSFITYEQAHMGLDLLTLVSKK